MADKSADSAVSTVRFLPSSAESPDMEDAGPESHADPRHSTFRPRRSPQLETPPLPPPVESVEPIADIIPYYSTTRWLSLLALTGLLCGVGYIGLGLYNAVRDSFVTPIVLSPDSDLVIPSKLSLSRLIAERSSLENRVREAASMLESSDAATEKLNTLKALVEQSLTWSGWVNAQTYSASGTDLDTLAQQKRLLQQRIAEQTAYVSEMERNVEAGLVHKTDVLREQSTLSQLRIAALENERERVVSEALRKQSAAAKRALSNEGAAVLTPEMLQQRDQLVRIELELLKLTADKRSRTDELRVAREELGRTVQLITQMRQRPVFRAIEAEQNVAFVPYSQLPGVSPGAAVYSCSFWGFFDCTDVGAVTEVLPGEVSMQDPWGALVRGQYALLELRDGKSAQAKLLRVRPTGQQPVQAPQAAPLLSAKP